MILVMKPSGSWKPPSGGSDADDGGVVGLS